MGVPSRSRGAMRPSLEKGHPRKREGAGNAGRTLHPRSRTQWREDARTSIRAQRRHPAFPAQWLYGLCRALPGDEFVLSPSPADVAAARPGRVGVATADLAPATGVRTTRFCRTLKRRSSCAPAIAHKVQLALRPPWRADALASTTSHPAFVTTRDRPSCRNGTVADKPMIWAFREAEFCPSCQSAAARGASVERSGHVN